MDTFPSHVPLQNIASRKHALDAAFASQTGYPFNVGPNKLVHATLNVHVTEFGTIDAPPGRPAPVENFELFEITRSGAPRTVTHLVPLADSEVTAGSLHIQIRRFAFAHELDLPDVELPAQLFQWPFVLVASPEGTAVAASAEHAAISFLSMTVLFDIHAMQTFGGGMFGG